MAPESDITSSATRDSEETYGHYPKMSKVYCNFAICVLLMGVPAKSSIEMSPIEVSRSVKILIRAINSPVRLTAAVCWRTDFALRFSKEFVLHTDGAPVALGLIRGNSGFSFSVQDEHHELILVDTRCDQSGLESFLNKTKFKLEFQYKWIFLNARDSKTIQRDIDHFMADQPILPRSTIFEIRKVSGDHFDYHQVYRTSLGEPLIRTHFGTYNATVKGAEGQFRMASTLTGLEQRRNLRGKHFNGVTVLHDKRSMVNYKNYVYTADTYGMTHLSMHQDLMQYANGSMTVTNSRGFGSFNKTTAIWSYLLGDLKARTIDLAAIPLFIEEPRVSFVQYLVSTHNLDAYFIFRRPTLSNTDNVFLLPFDRWVWISTCSFIVILVVLLTGVVLVEIKMSRVGDEGLRNGTLLRPSFSESWLVVFGATCQQGSAIVPNRAVARTVMILSFILLMFLFNSYAACITVLLQSPSNKIQTVRDLYESRLTMALHDNSWNAHYFAAQTAPLRRAVYNNKIKNPDGTRNLFSVEVGIQRLRAGMFAFHLEESTAYDQISRTFHEYEKCTLQNIRYVPKLPPFVAILKNSSYFEVLKVGVLRLIEHGVQSRHYRRIYAQKPECSGNAAMFISATLLDTMPAFLTLAWGTGAAVCALAVELLIKRFNLIKRRLEKLLSRFGK